MGATETLEMQRGERRFARAAMQTPLLTVEREQALARRWRDHGDERALHALTHAHARLAVALAARFRHYGLPISDLVQEGNVGLMLAAARFDPDRQVRFSTYAAWWIRAQIQDFVLRNWSIVRTGTTGAQKTLFFNLRRLRARIAGESGAGLTPDMQAAIAESLGVSQSDVAMMEGRLAAQDRSLNAPTADDATATWLDALADDHATPDEIAMQSHDDAVRANWIEKALAQLSPREAMIVRARQMTDEAPETLEAIGRRLGVSKERVRQIESAALSKLRASLLRAARDPSAMGLI